MKVLAIFGARVRRDGAPSAMLAGRVAHALDLLRREPFDHVILSGAARPPAPSEASIMARLLTEAGVTLPVTLDEAARNTMGNVRFLRGWCDAHPGDDLHIVSDRFHGPRIRMTLRAYGVAATLRPTACRAKIPTVIREGLGLAFYAGRLGLARIAGGLPKR